MVLSLCNKKLCGGRMEPAGCLCLDSSGYLSSEQRQSWFDLGEGREKGEHYQEATLPLEYVGPQDFSLQWHQRTSILEVGCMCVCVCVCVCVCERARERERERAHLVKGKEGVTSCMRVDLFPGRVHRWPFLAELLRTAFIQPLTGHSTGTDWSPEGQA